MPTNLHATTDGTYELSTDGAVAKAIAAYTEQPVDWVRICPDPLVRGVYAIRAQIHSREQPSAWTVDFLLRNTPLQEATADMLEEVPFTSWPPTA